LACSTIKKPHTTAAFLLSSIMSQRIKGKAG
jgi:hypothetical protein